MSVVLAMSNWHRLIDLAIYVVLAWVVFVVTVPYDRNDD